jgi:hypothetical protein
VAYADKTFAQLPDGEKDHIITGMENNSLQLQGTSVGWSRSATA